MTVRRSWPLFLLGAVAAAVAAIVALAVVPAPGDSAGPPSLRTTYLASTGEICDVELTLHLASPPRPATSALAAWRLSALDLNAVEFQFSSASSQPVTTETELAAVVRGAATEIEETLTEFGSPGARVHLGVSSDCRAALRANESGEPAVDIAAREPTGLLTGADFQGFVATSTGVVCELALRLVAPPDSTEPSIVALREFMAGLDVADLTPPPAESTVDLNGFGFSAADAEASGWSSQAAAAVFEYAGANGLTVPNLSVEGSYSCDR